MNRLLLILLFTSALLTGCGSSRHIQSIPIETQKEITRTDTIYINNVQYDSIYVSQDLFTDRSKDTILIRQHDVEYRYKIILDTIERIKIEVVRDSIPYEVRIETVQEVAHVPTPLKILAGIGALTLLALILTLFYKLR